MENNNGISFTGLLTCIFIGLKLTKVISWSWFWILSPILIPTIIWLVLLIIIGILTMMEGK